MKEKLKLKSESWISISLKPPNRSFINIYSRRTLSSGFHSQVIKLIRTELLCKRNFPLDDQTRCGVKLSSQLVNLLGTWPKLLPHPNIEVAILYLPEGLHQFCPICEPQQDWSILTSQPSFSVNKGEAKYV